MKIGVSSASLYPELLEDSLKMIGEAGIKTTELFVNTISEIQPEFISKLIGIKDYYGINIVSFHPFTSGFEHYMLFQSYQRRYRDCFELYKQYFSAAAQLGAKIFVLHGDKIGGSLSVEAYCERFMQLSDAAMREGVTLTQENVFRHRASDPDFIRSMISYLGNRAMFTFDIKQSVRSGYSPWEIYDAMRGHIAHIHLSDHNNSSDCMLPGKGNFNFQKLFRIALADGYNGAALVEVYRNAYRSERELFASYNELCTQFDNLY